LRADINPGVVINAISLLSPRNILQAEATAERAIDLGCDRVGFMPVRYFNYMETRLENADPEWFVKASVVIERLKQRQCELRIDSSVEYLDNVLPALMGQKSALRCYAGYVSVMVDPYGDVYPCEPYVRWRRPTGNVDETSIRTLWASKRYNRLRSELSSCRECFWNCTTELNILYNKLAPLRGPGAPTQAHW
jgi:MoaA/NifB/PqqE/SkfB family radical SAM enzyme